MAANTTTTPPDLVRVHNVSKRFIIRKDQSLKERLVTLGRVGRRHREDFWALRDIEITIPAGSTVGLIGHNGSGKSTLLKVIGGIIDPTTGNVYRRGRLAALLELGAGFHPDLTGRENVFLNASILGLSRAETEAQLDDILAFADIGEFIDTQVKFYSSGMYVRLAFAVAVHTDPDLLLVDEVLAVGDEAFQRKCMDRIQEFQAQGRTIVLVTHNLGQVVELCDRAVLLNDGGVAYDGAPMIAVQRFRELLEERQYRDAPFNPGSVDEITVTVAGMRDAIARPGDSIVVSARYSYPDLEIWDAEVRIENEFGQLAFSTSTRRMGTTLAPLTGSQRVALTLTDARFGPGEYFVSVSLLNVNGGRVVDAPNVARIVFADDGRSSGVGYARPRFDVTPD